MGRCDDRPWLSGCPVRPVMMEEAVNATICWLIGGVVFLAIAGFCCGQFGRTGPGRNSTSSESGTGTLLAFYLLLLLLTVTAAVTAADCAAA